MQKARDCAGAGPTHERIHRRAWTEQIESSRSRECRSDEEKTVAGLARLLLVPLKTCRKALPVSSAECEAIERDSSRFTATNDRICVLFQTLVGGTVHVGFAVLLCSRRRIPLCSCLRFSIELELEARNQKRCCTPASGRRGASISRCKQWLAHSLVAAMRRDAGLCQIETI